MFSDAKLTNMLANMLAILAVLAMAFALVMWVIKRPYFNISKIEIAPMNSMGLQYANAAGIQSAIADKRINNFFLQDLDQVRSYIEAAPWVRHAAVKRVWPNTLRVYIEEHQPWALWNENQLINTWGESFAANLGELADDQQLPQLNGPPNSERLVIQRYAELVRLFAPLGLAVEQATLTPRYAWEVSLSDGIDLMLGRDPAADTSDPHGRSGALPFASRINRFVRAWPELSKRLGSKFIASADLRYANGFAIKLASNKQDSLDIQKP